jgi:hypothetical protein
LLEKLEKQKQIYQGGAGSDADRKKNLVGEPGNPCICPKIFTDEEYENRFNQFAENVGMIPKPVYVPTKSKVKPTTLNRGMGFDGEEGTLENMEGKVDPRQAEADIM